MKRNFFNFRTAMAIVAMAVIVAAFTACSKDDDILNNVELQDGVSLKSLPFPGNPVVNSTDNANMHGDTVYVSIFKRHTDEEYPDYVSYVFDFSNTQLDYSITPDVTSDSTQSPAISGMITFFNQAAYVGASSKGCPGFIVGDGYEVANYTAYNTNFKGIDSLRCLELSDIADLAYNSDDTYNLPFLKSTHASCFTGGDLQQSAALDYYDANLTIGREYHIECGGSYTTPVWVIKDEDDNCWAFCVDPYQNGTTGGQTPPATNKQWSTFNYKYLGQL